MAIDGPVPDRALEACALGPHMAPLSQRMVLWGPHRGLLQAKCLLYNQEPWSLTELISRFCGEGK